MEALPSSDASESVLRARRNLLLGTGAALTLMVAQPLQAQSAALTQPRYPSRPVRLVVPFAAGSSPDVMARVWGERFARSTGQPVVVENRPGAATMIAAQAVKAADPDGYTLFWTVNNTFSINPYIYASRKLSYTADDFVPVTRILSAPFVLMVSSASKYQTLDDLIAAAKANPNGLSYSSAGIGTSLHVVMARLLHTAGVTMTHVAYKDTTFISDVIAQRVDATFDAAPTAIAQTKGGKLRALGVSSSTRIEALKDVAPIADRYPGFSGDSWQGIFAPKSTPREIVATVAEHSRSIVGSADFRGTLANFGLVPVGSTPEEFSRFLVEDARAWSQVIRANNIVAE